MRILILAVFLLGLLATGVLGTETRMLFFWPGCGLIGLAGLLTTLRWRIRMPYAPNDLCFGSMLVAVGYGLGRAMMSPVEVYAREDAFLLAAVFVTYLLCATVVSHPKARLVLLGTLLLVVAGNLAVGTIHFSGRWDFHVVPHFARSFGEGRIGGFFNNANHLAAFLSIILFPTIAWLCFGRGGAVLRLLTAFSAVAMVVGITLTQSRGAALGVAAGGVAFLVLGAVLIWRTWRHLFVQLLVGTVVLMTLAAALLFKVNQQAIQRRAEMNPVTEDVRLAIWESALEQHAESPLIGAGSRMFYDGSIRLRSEKLPVYAEEPLFAHNEFLQILADYGWVGLGLLILVVTMHAANGLRFLSWFAREKFPRTGMITSNGLVMVVGSLTGLAATLTHAIFEFHGHIPATALLGAAWLGVLANPGIESGSPRIPGVRLLMKFAQPALSVGMLAGLWFFGRADFLAAKASIAASQGNRKEQAEFLDQAISADPRNPDTHYARALAVLDEIPSDLPMEERVEPIERAIADLKSACALNSQNYLYPLALADAYDALLRHDEAKAQIERSLRLAPLHEEPRLALAIHFHRQARFTEAEKAYLWAGKARAWNEEGTARWIDSYRLMLQHAEMMRGSPETPSTAVPGPAQETVLPADPGEADAN